MKQTNLYKTILLISFLFIGIADGIGQKKSILRQNIGMSGNSSNLSINGNSYLIQQSIGQASVIGTFNSNSSELRQGFLQANVLSVKYHYTEELQINIYPNPFQTTLNIQLENASMELSELFIYDISGRLVYRNNSFIQSSLNLDFSSLKPGTYLIKIKSNNRSYSAQIQKI